MSKMKKPLKVFLLVLSFLSGATYAVNLALISSVTENPAVMQLAPFGLLPPNPGHIESMIPVGIGGWLPAVTAIAFGFLFVLRADEIANRIANKPKLGEGYEILEFLLIGMAIIFSVVGVVNGVRTFNFGVECLLILLRTLPASGGLLVATVGLQRARAEAQKLIEKKAEQSAKKNLFLLDKPESDR